MKNYADFLKEDIRLVILRILNEMPTYRANSSVLCIALDRYGHSCGRDQVKTELYWLQEQGLLTIEIMEPVLVATLVERGQDVAAGRVIVPGVKRPRA